MNVPGLTPEQRAYVAEMERRQDIERYGNTGTAGMEPGSTDFPQDPRGGLPRRVSPAVAAVAPPRPVAGAQRMDPNQNPFLSLLPKVDPPDAPPAGGMAPPSAPQAPVATTLPARPAEAPTGPQSAPAAPARTREQELLRQGLELGPVGNFMAAVPGRAAQVLGGLGARAADGLNMPGVAEGLRKFGAFRPTGFDPNSVAAKAGGIASDIVTSGKAAELAGAGVQAGGMALGASRVPMAAKMQQAMDAAGNAIRSFGGYSGLPKGAVDVGTRMAGGAVAGGVGAAVTDPDNIGTSAALGAAVPAVGAVGNVVGGALADVARPFTRGGREQIAGQVLRDAAQNPQRVQQLLGQQNNTAVAPLSLAERTMDPGIARLQHQLRADPQMGPRIAAFQEAQAAARSNALTGMVEGPNSADALRRAREAAVAPLYAQITPQTLQTPLNTGGVRRTVNNIMSTPRYRTGAVANEVRGAVTDDVANGIQRFGTAPTKSDPVGSWRKEAPAVDIWGARQNIDQRLYGGQSTDAKNTALEASRELNAIRRSLSTQLAKLPGFSAAEQTYAKASKPVDAADVLEQFVKDATNSQRDIFRNPMLSAAKFTNAMKGMDPKEWAKLTPQQKTTLVNLGSELADAATVQRVGMGPGSPTAGLQQGQKYLSGLINSGTRNLPGAGLLSGHMGTIAQRNENAVRELIASGLLDPATGAQLANRMPREILTPSLFGALNRGATAAPNLISQ